MSITYLIPTLGRMDNQPTLIYLRAAGVEPMLVVQDHEYELYRMRYPASPIMRLPPKIRTISPTRQYILENCPTRYMMMFDDDLRFSRKRAEDRSKLKDATPDDMRDMLAMVRSKLQRYTHVGISTREGNNRFDEPYLINTRMIRALGYDRDRVPPHCRFDRLPLKQDFDMTLQLLRTGRANCVIFEFAQDQVAGSNARGGCSVFRDDQMLADAAYGLQKLHPDYVTIVEKENKNWKQLNAEARVEVRVQWKRAFTGG